MYDMQLLDRHLPHTRDADDCCGYCGIDLAGVRPLTPCPHREQLARQWRIDGHHRVAHVYEKPPFVKANA